MSNENEKKMKRKLLNLATGELAALITFIVVSQLFNLQQASLIAFSYLIFILLQGSLYWFYRYVLLVNKRKVNSKVVSILKFGRLFNIFLIVMVGLMIPFVKSNMKDLIVAVFIFIFGVIEYINYYWYRLSYGKSGFNLKVLFRTKLQKSSIHKLITQ